MAAVLSPGPKDTLHPDRTLTPPRVNAPAAGQAARLWIALAVGSLVVAGLLSLSVVLGRLPFLSELINDPLFFKRCLVVHVILALVVWFYACIAGLLALGWTRRAGWGDWGLFCLAIAGVLMMLTGALMRGAEPVLANYVPVIDHPLFLAGLALFFAAITAHYLKALIIALSVPDRAGRRSLPIAVRPALQAAAIAVLLALATWISAITGLPSGLDPWTRYEFSAWGAGHVLQVANACAMLAMWLWMLERVTGCPSMSGAAVRWLFAILLAPHFAMPLLTLRGSLDAAYHNGATLLMRWGIFPVVLVVLFVAYRHLWRFRGSSKGISRSAMLVGFHASAGLTLLGMALGACIRSSTTLVPAHYHASLGGVTVSFMVAAYLVAEAAARESTLPSKVWRAAVWQLGVYGVGQAVFALGFAIGGIYGLGRKTYAAEQHVRSTGEYVGLMIMGVGGLIAVVGGLWFLFLILREIRCWWTGSPDPAVLRNLSNRQ